VFFLPLGRLGKAPTDAVVATRNRKQKPLAEYFLEHLSHRRQQYLTAAKLSSVADSQASAPPDTAALENCPEGSCARLSKAAACSSSMVTRSAAISSSSKNEYSAIAAQDIADPDSRWKIRKHDARRVEPVGREELWQHAGKDVVDVHGDATDQDAARDLGETLAAAARGFILARRRRRRHSAAFR
jgi:hypothetical protein